ncbi:4-hydroxybenzoyl-CoA thioesterase [Zhengella mangrovi]|uniref:4-hydroxybenzoyl-CoA thioesterase n=1 Tax=Zhengella mangrovi TaxID=1982044 RepID=A0A2G1QJ61_9HYPH|nr:thioesterase family protein [Zhengella mangrovi]PHP65491.1 4-hydroxybenzoyl-CoA thioesterase [Zhengella mangrovi]
MYVWARMIRIAATQRRRGPFRAGDQSRLTFRCLPTDIDPNLHLNNARYMMLADCGRLDIFFRSGLLKLTRSRNWGPLMGGVQAVYVREIRLWRRFEVVSTIETWEESQIIGRHRFLLEDGTTAAMVMTTAGIYDFANRQFVRAGDVIEALGYEDRPRPPTEAERAFMASHANLRAFAKQAGSPG